MIGRIGTRLRRVGASDDSVIFEGGPPLPHVELLLVAWEQMGRPDELEVSVEPPGAYVPTGPDDRRRRPR